MAHNDHHAPHGHDAHGHDAHGHDAHGHAPAARDPRKFWGSLAALFGATFLFLIYFLQMPLFWSFLIAGAITSIVGYQDAKTSNAAPWYKSMSFIACTIVGIVVFLASIGIGTTTTPASWAGVISALTVRNSWPIFEGFIKPLRTGISILITIAAMWVISAVLQLSAVTSVMPSWLTGLAAPAATVAQQNTSVWDAQRILAQVQKQDAILKASNAYQNTVRGWASWAPYADALVAAANANMRTALEGRPENYTATEVAERLKTTAAWQDFIRETWLFGDRTQQTLSNGQPAAPAYAAKLLEVHLEQLKATKAFSWW